MFFEKAGPVWDTLRDLQRRLDEADIAYVIIGGLALNAHDYPRQTIDVDIVLTSAGFERFRNRYVSSVYTPSKDLPRRFIDSRSDVAVDILISVQLVRHKGKNKTVRFPDSDEAEMHNDLRTLSLDRLVELKLVTWRFKDWGEDTEETFPEWIIDFLAWLEQHQELWQGWSGAAFWLKILLVVLFGGLLFYC